MSDREIIRAAFLTREAPEPAAPLDLVLTVMKAGRAQRRRRAALAGTAALAVVSGATIGIVALQHGATTKPGASRLLSPINYDGDPQTRATALQNQLVTALEAAGVSATADGTNFATVKTSAGDSRNILGAALFKDDQGYATIVVDRDERALDTQRTVCTPEDKTHAVKCNSIKNADGTTTVVYEYAGVRVTQRIAVRVLADGSSIDVFQTTGDGAFAGRNLPSRAELPYTDEQLNGLLDQLLA